MINVIGLGYIGLPTALMMASHGVEVIGTDYNKELVATLNAGKTTFKEDGLDELFQAAVKAGIKFTTEYQKTDMYIVSVPTPYDKFSKKVDACYVVAAVKEVMKVCPKGATVVVESTVSPGTIDKFVRPVIEANGFKIGEDINLVHAPERIIPGNHCSHGCSVALVTIRRRSKRWQSYWRSTTFFSSLTGDFTVLGTWSSFLRKGTPTLFRFPLT